MTDDTQVPTPEEPNTTETSPEVVSVTQNLNDISLQSSKVQVLGGLKGNASETEKQEGPSSEEQEGKSRKQRQKRNKASKREESLRQIPGLS